MSDRYHFRLIGHPEILGPATISAIRSHTQVIPDRYEAVLATGQTYSQLRNTKDWIRVDHLLSSVPDEQAEAELPPITDATHCHVFDAGQQLGPYVPQQIRSMWAAGTLTADASVFPAGYPDWIPIADFLARLQPSQPPTTPSSSSAGPLGVLLIVVGICFTIYFAAIYDTSVVTERRYLSRIGSVGSDAVVNLGKQQNRLIGVIFGIAMTAIGIVIVYLPSKSRDA